MPQVAIPPWLNAARPAPFYAQGVNLGMQAAQQRGDALLRQQQIAAAAAAQQQEALVAQQRMMVQQELAAQEMALKQQELGMTREQLAQEQAMNQMKLDEATRLAAARSEYQRRVAGGEPDTQVLAELGPALGMDTAYAALMRDRMSTDVGPQTMKLPTGETVVWNKGSMQIVKDPIQSLNPKQRYDLSLKIQKGIDDIYANNPMLSRKPVEQWPQEIKASLESYKALRDQLQNMPSNPGEGGALPPPTTGTTPPPGEGVSIPMGPSDLPEGGRLRVGSVSIGGPRTIGQSEPPPAWPTQEAAPVVLPLPKSKQALIEGQVYQTKYGPMEWNGEKFIKAKTQTQ